MTSKRRPGASQNGSGDRTLSKNARSQHLRSYIFFRVPKKRENQKKTMPGSGPGAPRNYWDGTPELPGWSPGTTGASQRILQAFFDQIWAELLAKTTLPAPRWTYLSRARRFVRSTLNYPTR